MRAVLVLAVWFSLVASVTAEKPFDFASTPGKLPKEVLPREYRIRIAPDLEKLTFTGSETVKLDVRKPVRKLVLNALELQIISVAVDEKPLPKSAVKLNPKEETLQIILPSELAPGSHTLSLSFTGKINQQGQGLFYCRYQEQGSGAQKLMLGTQFEATDARRMFPCWDEPSFRAQFQLTAIVPGNFLAVSNMPIETESKVEDAKEVRFGMTPSMASYLNVFVTGELDVIEGKSGETQIRVIATKNKAEMGRYALEATRQVLRYFNDYFGIPYPLPKLDQIALPGGFGGAMENWGGITYYETGLLFDPKNSSDATRQRIYEVVAHEVAHQWFGNLVTMAWWDNLWLNEGFASWLGSKCTEHFNPQWDIWLQKDEPRDPTRRIGIPKETAMEGDALSTTHPIQQKISTEAEANSAFDDITYKKGQSFIRMLESFLGEAVFREGIRKYMTAHKDSNTTTADLWSALSEASGKPVGEIAAGWTEQPGFPIVAVARKDGAKAEFSQERFTIHFPNPPSLQWKIPLTYALAGNAPATLLMMEKTAELPEVPVDRRLKLNVEGAGNYRVQYDPGSWKLLLGELLELGVPDRVNLLSDAWAFVQANRAPLSLYLGLVEKLPVSAELAEREQIINAFDYIHGLIVGTESRLVFQQYARTVLRPSFDRLGWEPKTGETARSASLRAALINALGNFGDQEVVAACRDRFQKFLADPDSLPPDLRASIFNVVGQYAEETEWRKLHELGLRTSSLEEKASYYDALARSVDPKLVRRTLQIALTDELPTSRALYLVPRVARHSEHPELAWQFAKTHMKQLLAKADSLGALRYVPSLFIFFSEPARIAELQAYAKKNLSSDSAMAVAQAVDEVGFRAEFKQRLLPQLTAWTARKRLGALHVQPTVSPTAP
jgi:aminopeptidase N